MTIEEFGRSIKEKYPQYQQYDDSVIGQKMLEKYPQYASKIDSQPRMTAQQALAKQVPVGQEMNVNPVVAGAGKVQEFLGNSELLPLIYASAMRSAVPVPGASSFLGGAFGERAKQSLAEGGPMAALKMAIPSLEQNPNVRNAVVGKGAAYGVTDLALSALPKLLNPRKTLGTIRQGQVAKSTAKISGDEIVKAVEENAKYVTPNEGESMTKLVEQAKEAYRGREIPIDEAMKIMQKAGDAYTSAGRAGKTVAADFNDAIYKSIRGQVGQLAPEVSRTTSALAATYNIPKAIKQLAFYLGVPASIFYGLRSLRGLGGGQ